MTQEKLGTRRLTVYLATQPDPVSVDGDEVETPVGWLKIKLAGSTVLAVPMHHVDYMIAEMAR